MYSNKVTLSVVIPGVKNEHVAREYISPVDRQTYVEGREGSNFVLRVRNDNDFRVLAIPSVDGLSVLDGKPAGNGSPGYIVDGNTTLDIPGWSVDQNTIAKFFFAGMKANGEDNSYVAQTGGDTQNKGFIGVIVFREHAAHTSFLATRSWSSIQPLAKRVSHETAARSMSDSAMATRCSAVFSDSSTRGGAVASTAGILCDTTPVMTQSLGAGFGEAANFETAKTEFKRGDLHVMIVIKYDDRRGLKRRGIEVGDPSIREGSAFPANQTGCVPPSGWTR